MSTARVAPRPTPPASSVRTSQGHNELIEVKPRRTSAYHPANRKKGFGRQVMNRVMGDSDFGRFERNQSIAGIASIMGRFRAHREQRRERLARIVQVAGISTAFGTLTLAWMFWLLFAQGVTRDMNLIIPFQVLAGVGFPVGFLLMSMADVEIDVIFDHRHPKILGSVYAFVAFASLLWVAVKGVPMLLLSVPPLYGIFYTTTKGKGEFTETVANGVMPAFFLGWGLSTYTRMMKVSGCHPNWGFSKLDLSGVTRSRNQIAECFLIALCVIEAVLTAVAYARMREHGKSYALFFTFNPVFVCFAGVNLALEFWLYRSDGTLVCAILGIMWVFVSLFCTVFRKEMAGLITKVFDQDQQIVDGAFAAELLDSVSKPTVGMAWWVMRSGGPKTEFESNDPRRFWLRGVVTSVDTANASMSVNLPPEEGEMQDKGESESDGDIIGGDGQQVEVASGTISVGKATLAAVVRTIVAETRDSAYEHVIAQLKRPEHFGRALTKEEKKSLIIALRDQRTVTVKSSYCSRSSAMDLLQYAQANMRCVPWSAITLPLLQNNNNGRSSRHPPVANTRSASRAVPPGQMIDFFVSHSWHDDPATKFATLEQVAEDFIAAHGREPTFWLDIACIDQTTIADGLKVLPINLMACKKVLVLVGSTYSSRLWCMWELYVLSMFNNENVMDNVVVAEHGGSGVNLSKVLGLFSLADSHCFDPNEETRLRAVIEAGGEADFCRSLRALGRQIGLQDKQNIALQELIGGQQSLRQELREEQKELRRKQEQLAGGQQEQQQKFDELQKSVLAVKAEVSELRDMCSKMNLLAMATFDAVSKKDV